MSIEKEPTTNKIPLNFNDKVKGYKEMPPSEEMIKAFRDLSRGEIPSGNLEKYFGEDWTPEIYKKFLEEIGVSIEEK